MWDHSMTEHARTFSVDMGVNSRAELATLARAYARNGASRQQRRWLGDKNLISIAVIDPIRLIYWLLFKI